MKTANVKVGFQTGEVSPLYEARVDHQKYPGACLAVENFWLSPEGAANRRPGTKFVAEAKNTGYAPILVPFQFSVTQAYILEFGHQYIRFYMNGGRIEVSGTPVEVTTTYTAAQLRSLRFAQSADVLYIVHEDHPPRKLSRTSHTSWTLQELRFSPPPTEEPAWFPATTLTLSSAEPGEDRTATAGAATFLAGDVGRSIVVGDGLGTITSVTSSTVAKVDILYAFSSTNYSSGEWKVLGTPDTKIWLSTGRRNAITTIESNAAAFRSTDVGRYLYVGEGLCKVTAYISATKVKARVLKKVPGVKKVDSDTATRFSDWTLEAPVFSDTNGYPRAVALYEQRLVFASNKAWPSTIWMSVTGDYENFTRGSDDSDSLTFSLVSNDVQAFRWLYPARVLMAGSVSAEWRIGSAGLGEALTPTSIDTRVETNYGSADAAAVRIDQAVLFVQRGAQHLRELAYSFEADAFVAPDLFRLARHLVELKTIDQPCFAKSPEILVLMPRSDGQMLVLTYTKPEGVSAWSRWKTDGEFLSVATIPGETETEIWAVVKRTISGSAKYYIEQFAQAVQDTADPTLWIFCDSALTYSGAGTTTLTGLSHLEGKTVQVWVNGAPHPDRTVSSGQITLNTQATTAVVGLRQESRLQTVRVLSPESALTKGLSSRGYRIDLDVRHCYDLQAGVSWARMEPVGQSSTLLEGLQTNVLLPGGYVEDLRIHLTTDANAPTSILGYVVRYLVDQP